MSWITSQAVERTIRLQAGESYQTQVQAADSDSDPLAFAWGIRPEVVVPPGSYAGGLEERAKPIDGLIREPSQRQILLTAPQTPGAYRLFVTVKDGKGHFAYGNMPFFVTNE